MMQDAKIKWLSTHLSKFVAGVLLTIGCLWLYSFLYHSAHELRLFTDAKEVGLIGLVFGSVFLVAYFIYLKRLSRLNPNVPIRAIRKRWLTATFRIWLTSPIIAILWIFVRYFGDIYVQPALQWASEPSGHESLVILTVGAGTVLTGTIFFYFRLHLRAIYGVFEAGTGVVIVVDRIRHTNLALEFDSSVYATILTAGVYLIVRGFDNVHQYLIGKAEDKAITPLIAWLNVEDSVAKRSE